MRTGRTSPNGHRAGNAVTTATTHTDGRETALVESRNNIAPCLWIANPPLIAWELLDIVAVRREFVKTHCSRRPQQPRTRTQRVGRHRKGFAMPLVETRALMHQALKAGRGVAAFNV